MLSALGEGELALAEFEDPVAEGLVAIDKAVVRKIMQQDAKAMHASTNNGDGKQVDQRVLCPLRDRYSGSNDNPVEGDGDRCSPGCSDERRLMVAGSI